MAQSFVFTIFKFKKSKSHIELSHVKAIIVEVKMRYLSHDVARHFGSSKKTEIVHLSDNAIYEHLLGLLKEKYETAVKKLYKGKLKEKMLDTFVLICEGKPLLTIRDKLVNPDIEVLVAYLGYGG